MFGDVKEKLKGKEKEAPVKRARVMSLEDDARYTLQALQAGECPGTWYLYFGN